MKQFRLLGPTRGEKMTLAIGAAMTLVLIVLIMAPWRIHPTDDNNVLKNEADTNRTEYRISQQDILQISVFQVNDLNGVVQVSQDGTVTLPPVGKVQLVGKTTSEAEQIIAARLRQKYLQSPQARSEK